MASAVLRPSVSPHSRRLHPAPLLRPFRFDSRPAQTRRRTRPATVLTVRSEVSFSTGALCIPHPNKVDRGGEDAFFTSSYNGGVLGVADGVSGWAARDVDPARFSQEIMSHALRLVEDEEVNYEPQILLGKAHAATSSIGSATVGHHYQEAFIINLVSAQDIPAKPSLRKIFETAVKVTDLPFMMPQASKHELTDLALWRMPGFWSMLVGQ